MKDFLGQDIALNDEVVIAAYGEMRLLRKAKVVEILEKEGYIRLAIEVGKEKPLVDVVQPEFMVVTNYKPKSTKSRVNLFDL